MFPIWLFLSLDVIYILFLLAASNYSTSYYEKVLSSSLCTTNATNAYNTYSRYLKITFDRSYKRSFAYRGFVAGYVMFSKCHAMCLQDGYFNWNDDACSYCFLKFLLALCCVEYFMLICKWKQLKFISRRRNALLDRPSCIVLFLLYF